MSDLKLVELNLPETAKNLEATPSMVVDFVNLYKELIDRQFEDELDLLDYILEICDGDAGINYAYIDEDIVEAVACLYLRNDSAWLQGLVVHPESRGYGYGRSMMKLLLEDCRQRGLSSMSLAAFSTAEQDRLSPTERHEDVTSFYQRLGFEATGRVLKGVGPVMSRPIG